MSAKPQGDFRAQTGLDCLIRIVPADRFGVADKVSFHVILLVGELVGDGAEIQAEFGLAVEHARLLPVNVILDGWRGLEARQYPHCQGIQTRHSHLPED